MKGHWQKEVPLKDGTYWTATRGGELDRPRVAAYNSDGKLVFAGISIGGGNEGWKGWWWSEPVEEPPLPPKWEYPLDPNDPKVPIAEAYLNPRYDH